MIMSKQMKMMSDEKDNENNGSEKLNRKYFQVRKV